MHYKSLTLEILQQHPAFHEHFRASGTRLQTMERCAVALKSSHESWKNQLSRTRPVSDPVQIASEALELALQEFQESLPQELSPSEVQDEPLSLDAAMAFISRHTPPG